MGAAAAAAAGTALPLAAPAGAADAADAPAGRPLTVPGLQEWTPGEGEFTLTRRSRITAPAALAGEAAVLAEDLQALTGLRLPVTRAAAKSGDLRLTVDGSDAGLGAEGYTLHSGGILEIAAPAAAGVFRGTRSLLQLLAQSRTVPGGTARDWPAKPYRGLMLDCGRKYFTVDWLHRLVRQLAHHRLNTLHLHLTDSEGFRIESSSHPEVVSRDGALTKDQVRGIVALAGRHHIEVIPEIDLPGHMQHVLGVHPELGLPGSTTTLDLSREPAHRFIEDLLEEYLPLFPGRYWHIGGDEADAVADNADYIAYARAHYLPSGADPAKVTGNDCVFGFLNRANRIVRAHGKTMRMWDDGLDGVGTAVVVPDTSIEIDYWTSRGPAPTWLADRGHALLNAGSPPTYYAAGGGWGYRKDNAWTYQNWNADDFLQWTGPNGGWTPTPFQTVTGPRNRGAAMHLWADNGGAETEDHIAEHSDRLTRIVAQAGWGSPRPAPDYPSFVRAAQAVGDAPGGLPATDLALHRPAEATAGDGAAAAVDDDPSTGWTAAGAAALTADLGAAARVERLVVQWGTQYAVRYRLQGSADGRTWTDLAVRTDGRGGAVPYRKATTEQDEIDFDPRAVGTDEYEHLDATARFVRLRVEQAATPGDGVQVMSLRVFGARPA